MRISETKKGAKIVNKVTGEKMIVTYKNDEKLLAFPMDIATGEPVEGSEAIEISSENDICFRRLSNPDPTEKPSGYSVKDGMLIDANGKEVTQQGELYITDIVGYVNGAIILQVKVHNASKLYSYMPDYDRFREFVYLPGDNTKVLKEYDNVLLVANWSYQEMRKSDDSGNEDVNMYFEGNVYAVYAKHCIGSTPLEAPINTQYDILSVKDDTVETLYIPHTSKIDENGVIIDSELAELWYSAICVDVGSSGIWEGVSRMFNGREILSVSIAHNMGDIPVFRGLDFIDINGIRIESKDIKNLDGYNYLVDITKDHYMDTYTFANAEYQIKKVTVSYTRDRGNIVTVS